MRTPHSPAAPPPAGVSPSPRAPRVSLPPLCLFAACALAPLVRATDAAAQTIPAELVPPGETIATTTDATSERLNPGAVPIADAWSVRYTHVSELRAHDTALNGDALSGTAPLIFGLAGSAGLSWQRPQVPGASGNVITASAGLSYAVLHRMGVGAQIQFSGAGGDASLAPLDGGVSVNVGWAWRISPLLSLGITGLDLLGPRVPAIGIDRGVVGGVGVRPFGTDVLTLGVDGSVFQGTFEATGWARAGVRVRIPYVGMLRAEGVVDWPTGQLRGAAGLDVTWGQVSAGGGVLAGTEVHGVDGPLGFYATARLEPERDRGIPTPSHVVALSMYSPLGDRSLSRLLLRLERLRRDPTVRGIVWVPRDDVGGLANAEELREEFGRLRASGKRVVCHLLEPNGSTYYACTAADLVEMDPAGSLRIAGVRTARYFLGDALRSLGVRTEFVRIGAWKSAPEQFTRHGSTREGLAQEEELLDDFYGALLRGLATSRRWTVEHTRELVEGGPYTAQQARALGLVDVIATRGMAERAAGEASDASVVELDDYVRMRAERWAPGPEVAVVHVDGDLVDGESFEIPFIGMKFVGDRTIAEQFAELESNSRVRAIVLRIDSGGGSAMASEMMWRAVARVARSKPVVVSIGREAASGGYYIAAPGREIFADPSAVTGSIGIFFGKADVGVLLDRLGVGVELSRRGPRADMDSVFRAFTPDERVRVEQLIHEGYELFLSRVAAGRHTDRAAINRVGEGRVFAGLRAQRVGLVDRLGGLISAIDRARELAGLPEDSAVEEYPPHHEGLLETLASVLVANGTPSPTARLFETAEVRDAAAWLLAVAWAGRGRAMALTEWPLMAP